MYKINIGSINFEMTDKIALHNRQPVDARSKSMFTAVLLRKREKHKHRFDAQIWNENMFSLN